MRSSLILLSFLGACETFETPAQLAKTQIIAIEAVPASISPGQSTTLTATLAGPDGLTPVTNASWQVIPAVPGVPPLGTVTTLPDQSAQYTAPAMIDEDPAFASVELTIPTGDGLLSAIKAVPISNIVSLSNPTIDALKADAVTLAGTWNYPPGAAATLSVETSPESTDDFIYAWYSTIGEIKFYQSNPTDIILPDEGIPGTLIVVVRDGQAGIAWQSVDLVPQ